MNDERGAGTTGERGSVGGMRRLSDRMHRRGALRILGGVFGAVAGAGAGLGGLTSGCRGGEGNADASGAESASPPPAEPVRVPLERLPDGGRLQIRLDETPVELSRRGERITARSLRCTHFGCTVAWEPERAVYACPCHDGVFAADGRVLAGPPSRPLPTLRVERMGDAVVVRPPEEAVAATGSGS